MTTDTRIAYGATCTWWDSIARVGAKAVKRTASRATINGRPLRELLEGVSEEPSWLPCCPHCKGMLFEKPDEAAFLEGAQRYEADGHPGYVAFIKWARGRCFPSFTVAQQAYEARK